MGMDSVEANVPAQTWSWLRPFIPKKLQPYIRGARKRLSGGAKDLPEPYRSAFPYTVAHPIRQETLVELGRRMDGTELFGLTPHETDLPDRSISALGPGDICSYAWARRLGMTATASRC